MQLTFFSKNNELSDALQEYADKKINNMRHVIGDNVHAAEIRMSKEGVEFVVKFTAGNVSISAKNEDAYAAIDELADKIARKYRRQREKTQAQKRTTSSRHHYDPREGARDDPEDY